MYLVCHIIMSMVEPRLLSAGNMPHVDNTTPDPYSKPPTNTHSTIQVEHVLENMHISASSIQLTMTPIIQTCFL